MRSCSESPSLRPTRRSFGVASSLSISAINSSGLNGLVRNARAPASRASASDISVPVSRITAGSLSAPLPVSWLQKESPSRPGNVTSSSRRPPLPKRQGTSPASGDVPCLFGRGGLLELELVCREGLSKEQAQRGIVIDDKDSTSRARPGIRVSLRLFHLLWWSDGRSGTSSASNSMHQAVICPPGG